MLSIQTVVDRKALQGIRNFAEKQLPFGVARALTWTAQDAQKDVKNALPKQFTLRNNYLNQSIRINPATKSRWEAQIGFATSSTHSTDFMVLQEDGGTKTPTKQMLAIPVGIRSSKNQLIKKSQKPAAILKRKNVFIGRPNDRPLGIYQRLPNDYMKMLYRLVPKASVKPELHLDRTVQTTIKRRFQQRLTESLEQASR